jgi:hypothetical protein
MERLALRKNGTALRGFQWKKVFLPDGTSLRTSYRDTIEFAKVVGDHIVSDDGTALTPSLFANWVRTANCRAHIDDQLRMRSKKRPEMYKTI